MVECSYARTLNAAPAELWALCGNFGEVGWLPGPERVETVGEGVGMTRRLHIPGLEEPIEETLESFDEARRQLSYRVKKNPFVPYENYRARLSVEAAEAGSQVRIESSFELDPAALAEADSPAAAEQAARAAMTGIYAMMMDALAKAAGEGAAK